MAIDRRWNRWSAVVRPPVPLSRLRANLIRAGVFAVCGHAAVAQAQTSDNGLSPTGQQAQSAVNSTGAQGPGNGGIPRDPWRFVPSIGLDEMYSDNINLSSKGNERSDFVTTISPGLNITRYGSRLTANFYFSPQFVYYARGTNGSTTRNALDATATSTLIENLLFFDARSSIYQSNISPFGSLSANTQNGSSNRAETRYYSFGPTARSRVGSDLTYEAGYRFSGSSSDSASYGKNTTNQGFASFESGTSIRNLGYGANVSYVDQSFGGRGEVVSESASADLTYQLLPTFRLRGSAGYDRNSYPTTGEPDLKGPSYSGGFDWIPSQHTQLKAQVGHRYFGPTANIVFQQTTATMAVSLLYTRDQTTSSSSGLTLAQNPGFAAVDQFFQATIPDPVQRARAVTDYLNQSGLNSQQFGITSFLSNQLYLEKRLQATLTIFGLRNTLTLSAYRTEQQALSNFETILDVFNQAQKIRQTGYSATLAHKLGPRTDVNVSYTKTHNTALIGSGDTRQRVLQATINRQLGKRLSGYLQYRNTTQTGASDTLGNFYGGNYRENAILGSLRLTF